MQQQVILSSEKIKPSFLPANALFRKGVKACLTHKRPESQRITPLPTLGQHRPNAYLVEYRG
jgi:hypothetical protein